MTERVCAEHGVLIAYLYDDLPVAERRAFEQHLQQCTVCAETLAGFGQVREGLGAWVPPDIVLEVDVMPGAGPRAATTAEWADGSDGSRRTAALRAEWLPWLRGVAAAVLVGIGLAAANLHVTVGQGSVTLSTGWLAPPPAASGAASLPPPSTVVPPVADAGGEPEWRTALTRLESSLREELAAAARTAAPAVRAGDPTARDLSLERVRALIAESEQRQQRELALRLTQFGRDFDQQRRTDLVRINQGFGQFEGRTGAEIARQRQMLDYIMRVSAPPPQQ